MSKILPEPNGALLSLAKSAVKEAQNAVELYYFAKADADRRRRQSWMTIAAKAYVASLNTARGALDKMTASGKTTALTFIDNEFPDLVEVRHSLAHPEDRALGKAYDKPIDIKTPPRCSRFGTRLNVLAYGIVHDWPNIYVTVRNGELGSVRIDVDILQKLQKHIESVRV